MILGAHNAHLMALNGPSVPADPGLNIVGGVGRNKWTGDAQAYVDEDTTETARGNQRQEIFDAVVDIPQNFPVMPEVNDVLTLVRLEGSVGQSEAHQVVRLQIRMIDRGLIMTGRLRLHCRVA